MTKEEFIKKYCWAPDSASECAQITWDLLEEIWQDFENNDDTKTVIGASHYKIETLLDVMDKSLPDYKFLAEVYETLDKIE